MWISAKQYREKYNITPQHLYALKIRGQIKIKPYVNNKYLIWDPASDENDKYSCIYNRAASKDDVEYMNNNNRLLKEYMISNGVNPEKIYCDISNGINEPQKNLSLMIEDILYERVACVYITNKERLSVLNFDLLKLIFAHFGTDIKIINIEDDVFLEKEECHTLCITVNEILNNDKHNIDSATKKVLNFFKK